MASQTWPLASIFLTLTTRFAYVTSQYEYSSCLDKGSYTNESFYRGDLNTLLRSLSSNIRNNGFYNASVGEANAFALCRADIQLTQCRGCIDIVADEIQQRCPNEVQAIMWQQYCMVLYSNDSIFGTLTANETAGEAFAVLPGSVERPEEYYKVRGKLLDDLRAEAAKGGALRKAAAGKRTTAANQTIYAMVECRPDLSPENCRSCLVNATRGFAECCPFVLGSIIYRPSCTVRYETDRLFYNLTRLQEPLELSMSPSSSPPSAGNDYDNRTRNIIIIVVSIIVFLIVALCLCIFARKRQKKKYGYEISSVESIQFDFGKIRAATNDFSDKLGEGGFGNVYKGKLQDGREIAVKRLSKNSFQGDHEFKNEVMFLARLQHRNLVRLLGFSLEGTERLLVYEFVQNGSLDRFIFDPIRSSDLDWDTRYKIIGGVARGLLYLHEDSRFRIIHLDLKASNVLLDEEMNPKISDFGQAKQVVPDATHEHTSRIVGTDGYMAPEYTFQGHISIKSDIYSFGVLILEIITGQKKINVQNDDETSGDLLSHAWRCWREGISANMIDPVLKANSAAEENMRTCIHIALLCVQKNPNVRPRMASVVHMLNSIDSISVTLPSPSMPGFYIPSSFSNASLSQVSEYDSHKMDHSRSSKGLLD